MSDQQQTAKVIKAEPSEESSEEPRTSRTVSGRRRLAFKPLTAIKRKRTFSRYELPECLEEASGNLRWQEGVYFENAKGVASIALVATRMLRDMLYSHEQMTARDTQEMEHFLNYVGDERDIRRYTEGLRLIGKNNNETSDTRFRDIFKGDRTSTS